LAIFLLKHSHTLPMCHSAYRWFSKEDAFVFVPEAAFAAPETDTDCLVINRASGSFKVVAFHDLDTESLPAAFLRCFGLLGCLTLLTGRYILVVTGRSPAGQVPISASASAPCYAITCVNVISIAQPLPPSSVKDELHFLRLFREHLAEAGLYYSPTTDLTWRYQAPQQTLRPNFDFLWNGYVARPFALHDPASTLAPFVVRAIRGFFGTSVAAPTTGLPVSVALIARRSVRHAGTRYNRRGLLPSDGSAANFVESEIVVSSPSGHCASFLQIRGSCPAVWGQVSNMAYKPAPWVADLPSCLTAAEKHFSALHAAYALPHATAPSVLVVDLLARRGAEAAVSERCDEVCTAVAAATPALGLQYLHFDFHQQCTSLDYTPLSQLVAQAAPFLASARFTLDGPADGSFERVSQAGVIRTNCFDSLDRTNVVQTKFFLSALDAIAEAFARVTGRATPVVLPSDAELKNLFAAHGDAISSQYAGTAALKGDFTRLGYRTKRGLVADGVNALLRYHRNNFRDGRRQDGYDLFLGVFRPRLDAIGTPPPDRARRGSLASPPGQPDAAHTVRSAHPALQDAYQEQSFKTFFLLATALVFLALAAARDLVLASAVVQSDDSGVPMSETNPSFFSSPAARLLPTFPRLQAFVLFATGFVGPKVVLLTCALVLHAAEFSAFLRRRFLFVDRPRLVPPTPLPPRTHLPATVLRLPPAAPRLPLPAGVKVD
jgi:hypothetical protein